MGLVDYSDSGSDSDSPRAPTNVASQPAKRQVFQKLVDKSNPGKILVNLPSAPTAQDDTATGEGPAAKRLKTSGGRFSGFGSFLPPPKRTASRPQVVNSGGASPRAGVNLRTSSEAAFRRNSDGDVGDAGRSKIVGPDGGSSGSGLVSKQAPVPAQSSMLHAQKPEDQVKLVGKPLMFKPLSVASKPGKRNGEARTRRLDAAASTKSSQGLASGRQSNGGASAAPTNEVAQAALQNNKKKVSLFSVADDTQVAEPAPEDYNYEYESPGHGHDTLVDESATYDLASEQQKASHAWTPAQPAHYSDPTSLNSIADDLNLDPAARRELFGRGGAPSKATAKSVINFNLDQEYRHNEELRQSGTLDQQKHNPLRAIKPGKHSLQQLVNQVQSQRDALEENFAKNRATQKQSGAKYGF